MRWLEGKVSLWGPKRPAIEVPQSLEMSWQFNFGWRRTLARIFQVFQRVAGNQVVQGSYQTKSKVRLLYVFSSKDSMCYLSQCQFQIFFPAYSTRHTTHYLQTIFRSILITRRIQKTGSSGEWVPSQMPCASLPSFLLFVLVKLGCPAHLNGLPLPTSPVSLWFQQGKNSHLHAPRCMMFFAGSSAREVTTLEVQKHYRKWQTAVYL